MNIHQGIRNSITILLAILFLGAGMAYAQKVQVKSADPSAAEQGIINLGVTINGNGFDDGSVATFLLSGTTNPAGITVHNTQFVNSRKLVAKLRVVAISMRFRPVTILSA